MNKEQVNSIIGIKESFELPNKLMKILQSSQREKIFNDFMEIGEELDHDWFTQYFEEEHANKSKMAQDFTPKEVADLVASMAGEADCITDLCAGTGGLAISAWSRNREASFICYELSQRVIPLLLFNLAIRNIKATVLRSDILTGEIFERYKIIKGERFGKVVVEAVYRSTEISDVVISNPPYSMKYANKNDERFPAFSGMLPSNYADYVFVFFALSLLKKSGKAVFILPHGVLFRRNKERDCRKYLIENKIIRTIIGLPDKLFINTDIPTMIMELDTAGVGDGVLFIDAKEARVKNNAKNVIDLESLNKILDVYEGRKITERFSDFALYQKIADNDYNMNIPRYVDTYVPEKVPDLKETLVELAALEKEAAETGAELVKMAMELYGTTADEDRDYKAALKAYKDQRANTHERYEQEVLDLSI